MTEGDEKMSVMEMDPEIEKQLDIEHTVVLTSLEGVILYKALEMALEEGSDEFLARALEFEVFGFKFNLGIPRERLAEALKSLKHKLDTCS